MSLSENGVVTTVQSQAIKEYLDRLTCISFEAVAAFLKD